MCSYVPWAGHAAKSCNFLLSVRYEELLEHSLEDVRSQLNFVPAPEVEIAVAHDSNLIVT